jgi:hypothetical protein
VHRSFSSFHPDRGSYAHDMRRVWGMRVPLLREGFAPCVRV